MTLLHEEALIKKLMLDELRGGNVNIIRDIYWEDEERVILQTPISVHGREDKLIWRLTANGMFLVKSTHTTTKELKNEKCEEDSNGSKQT